MCVFTYPHILHPQLNIVKFRSWLQPHTVGALIIRVWPWGFLVVIIVYYTCYTPKPYSKYYGHYITSSRKNPRPPPADVGRVYRLPKQVLSASMPAISYKPICSYGNTPKPKQSTLNPEP